MLLMCSVNNVWAIRPSALSGQPATGQPCCCRQVHKIKPCLCLSVSNSYLQQQLLRCCLVKSRLMQAYHLGSHCIAPAKSSLYGLPNEAASCQGLLLHKKFCNVADLVINSSLVASSLNSALALSITAVDSSSASSSGGAQLTEYSLTTAAVNNNTLVLSGVLNYVCCAVLCCAVLCCAVLCCAVLCCVKPYCGMSSCATLPDRHCCALTASASCDHFANQSCVLTCSNRLQRKPSFCMMVSWAVV